MAQAEIETRSSKSSRRTKVAPAPQPPLFYPPLDSANVNVSVRAEMHEIARLGPERAAAFMNGVARVINATNLIRERP